MKILVTGGAGFIGANLTLELEKRFSSAKISALDDLSSSSRENLSGFKGEFIKGKIEDKTLINSLEGKKFDFIFHQAAITDTTITDEEKMMQVNVDGLKNLLNLAKKERSRVIYASSAGVYGNGPAPMKEDQELSPLNAYALSKVKQDEVGMDFARENNLVIIGLRYFNVYGKGESKKGKSASMIWQLAQQMKEGKTPRIFKWGKQKRDFIYIKDVVEANLKAMEAKESAVVNIGTGLAITFNEIIEVLNRVLKTAFDTEYFDNSYDFYQNNTQAHTALAEHILGFKAGYSIEEGIRDYLSI